MPQSRKESNMMNTFRSQRRIGNLGISSWTAVAALLALIGLGVSWGQQSSYTFTRLATLGEKSILVSPPAGPIFHINDFEPGGLNNSGDVVYATDLGTSGNPAEW